MKRGILTVTLSLVIVSGVVILPIYTSAVPKDGDFCMTDYIDTLVGSDGEYYYRNGVQKSIVYNTNGTTDTILHENYDGPRKHYQIIPYGQGSYYGYCVEQGLSFPDANRYTGSDWKNDVYFAALPKTVRNGILLATIFGLQPGKSVPVQGCNQDDWYWATQVIIWEYQQQLRVSPTQIQGNGYVPANYFQSTLDLRPAEKCYDYMLAAMTKYQQIPSFTSATQSEAATNLLKWDSLKSQWQLKLDDSNLMEAKLTSKDNKVKISQYGNEYTITTSLKLEDQVIEFKKDIPLPSHDMLIWGGGSDTQAIATGTADPVSFFIRLRTENPGGFELHKTSDNNQKEGFVFQLTDQNGVKFSFTTDKNGFIDAQLFPGEYVVDEQETEEYRLRENQIIQITENTITSLDVQNILKKGIIKLQKSVKDSIKTETKGESGAVFQIFPEEFLNYENSPDNLRDYLTTDETGNAVSKELPLGDYIVHQTAAGKHVTISPDIPVTISKDLQSIALSVENEYQKGKIQVFKTSDASSQLAGAAFTVRADENITDINGTIRLKVGSLVDTIITDVNGLASTCWLYPGKYTLEEVICPQGYEMPSNPITSVTIDAKNNTDIIFMTEVPIKNHPIDDPPETGDDGFDLKVRNRLIFLLIGLVGMVITAYLAGHRDKPQL